MKTVLYKLPGENMVVNKKPIDKECKCGGQVEKVYITDFKDVNIHTSWYKGYFCSECETEFYFNKDGELKRKYFRTQVGGAIV